MAGEPWLDYQSSSTQTPTPKGPWEEYQTPSQAAPEEKKPWEEYSTPATASAPTTPTAPALTANGKPTPPVTDDYLSATGRALAQGVASTVGSTMTGYGADLPREAQDEIKQQELLGSSAPPVLETSDPATIAAFRQRRAASHPSPEQTAERIAVREPMANTRPQDTWLYRKGVELENAPGPSQHVLNPLVENVLQGVGSVGANIVGGLIPGVGPAVAAASAIGQGAGEAAESAVKAKASPKQVQEAAAWGAVPGSTDLLDQFLPKFGVSGKVAGIAKRIATRVLKGGFTEGLQEGVQQGMQNFIEQRVYNPDKNLKDDVFYNWLVGSITGGLVSGVIPHHSDHDTDSGEVTPDQIVASLHILNNTDLPPPPVEAKPSEPIPVQPPGLNPGQAETPAPAQQPGLPADSVAPGAPGQTATPPAGTVIQDQSGVTMPEGAPNSLDTQSGLIPQRQFIANAGPQAATLIANDMGFPGMSREVINRLSQTLNAQEYAQTKQQLQEAETVALIQDFGNTSRDILASDPAEGEIHTGETPHGGIQADVDFAPDVHLSPRETIKQLPEWYATGPVEVAVRSDGTPVELHPHHTATVGDWIRDTHPDPVDGEVHGLVHKLVSTRLLQTVAHVPVHIVPDRELFQFIAPSKLDKTFTPMAAYIQPGEDTSHSKTHVPHVPRILIKASAMTDGRTVGWLIRHEATHAATLQGLENNQTVNAQVLKLMKYVNDVLTDVEFARTKYAFTNTKEFIAEVFSNPLTQDVLANVPIPRELKAELEISTRVPTVWDALVRLVQRVLGLSQREEAFTALEAALRLGDRIIDVQGRLLGSQLRNSQANYVMGIHDNRTAIKAEDPTADIMVAVGTQPELFGATAAMGRLWKGRGGLPPQVHAYLGHANRMAWQYKWTAGLDQTARSNPNHAPILGYVWDTSQMQHEETQIGDVAVKIAKDWLRLGEQADRLAAFIDDIGHMRYRDPSEVGRGIVRHPSSQEFTKLVQKHKLGPTRNGLDGLVLFGQITKATQGFLLRIRDSIITYIKQKGLNPQDEAKEIQAVMDQVQNLQKRPYFPFTNFGDHYVGVRDPAGKLIGFTTVERQGVQSAKRLQAKHVADFSRKWKSMYGRDPVVGKEIFYGIMQEHVKPFVGLPGPLLQHIGKMMLLSDEQINVAGYLIAADAADSAPMLQHQFQRKYYLPGYGLNNVEGYSTDLRRSFARFFFHGARYYTRLKYFRRLEAHIQNAEKMHGNKEGEIAQYMRDHFFNTIKNAKGAWGWLKGFIFLDAMGYSVAAATQNLSQTPVITFPFLAAKFGDVRATKALVKAMQEVRYLYTGNSLKNTTGFQFKAMEYAIKSGRISESQAAELAGMSQNSILSGFGGTKWARGQQLFMQGSAWAFEQAEQMNRRIAFRAALDLAQQRPNAKYIDKAIKQHNSEYQQLLAAKWSDAEARATIAALDAVEQTQYVYARWATPRMFRGRLPATLFVFKKYIQSTIWMLGQNPDVALRYFIISLLLTGLQGLPGAEDLESLANALGKWKFGRDFNVEHEARRFILKMTGGDPNDPNGDSIAADIILHGLARRGFGLPALLDALGSFATGTPGRGLAAPRHVKDPQTGEVRPEGFAKNVPFPVMDRSRAMAMGQISPVDLGAILQAAIVPGGVDIDQLIAQQTQKASGAVFSAGLNMFKAISDNQYALSDWKRWERGMPRALGDAVGSWRAFSEGRERIRGGPNSGMTVLNYGPNPPPGTPAGSGAPIGKWFESVRDTEQLAELVAESIGYNTFRKQARWDYIMAETEREKYWQANKEILLQTMNEAIAGGRKEEIDSAKNAIIKFNNQALRLDYAKGYVIDDRTIEKSVEGHIISRAKKESGVPLQNQQGPLMQDTKRLYPEATIDVRRR